MEAWTQMGQKLRELIAPATLPVAVTLLEDEGQIPEKARRPLRDLHVRMAPCQGSAMARLYGWTVGFAQEDVGCAIAAHTYGWDRLGDEKGAVHFLTRMNYASDEQAALEAMRSMPTLETERPPAVLYAPLERAPLEPHVILIYVNPAQMMRLVHGATYHTGKSIESRFGGRAGSCSEGVLGAHRDQTPKVVVPGNGDRVWAGCQDHEMVMAVPVAVLPRVIEGLEKTHRTGIRYPIPAYLRYQPEVGFTVPLADIFRPDRMDKLFAPRGR